MDLLFYDSLSVGWGNAVFITKPTQQNHQSGKLYSDIQYTVSNWALDNFAYFKGLHTNPPQVLTNGMYTTLRSHSTFY
jgi:hypothetical protein